MCLMVTEGFTPLLYLNKDYQRRALWNIEGKNKKAMIIMGGWVIM